MIDFDRRLCHATIPITRSPTNTTEPTDAIAAMTGSDNVDAKSEQPRSTSAVMCQNQRDLQLAAVVQLVSSPANE